MAKRLPDFEKVTKDQLVPLMQELIRNKCVNDGTPESGNEIRSAETLGRFLSSYGIDYEILSALPNRANLLVKIPGTNPAAESLMLMGHTDVVPANPSQWSCDPFEGVVRDGYLYGRGAVDMLNMTASMAVATALSAKDRELEHDLYFLAVADEEASGRYGARWLAEHHWDKIKTDYMITELGGFFVNTPRGRGITVTVGEKGVAWVQLTFSGTSAHGSMPYGSDNAAVKAGIAMARLGAYRGAPEFSSQYKRMVKDLSSGMWEEFLLLNRFTVEAGLKRVFHRDPGTAKFLHTASRMTFSPNIVSAGAKLNVVPDTASVKVDIRILPGETVEDVQERISHALGDLAEDAQIQFLEFFPSTVSPVQTPLMDATRRLAGGVDPDAAFMPMYIGGATDGRFWRQRGTVVYGFSLFDPEMTVSNYASMIHGKDERISLASLRRSLEFFYRLPEELKDSGI